MATETIFMVMALHQWLRENSIVKVSMTTPVVSSAAIKPCTHSCTGRCGYPAGLRAGGAF